MIDESIRNNLVRDIRNAALALGDMHKKLEPLQVEYARAVQAAKDAGLIVRDDGFDSIGQPTIIQQIVL